MKPIAILDLETTSLDPKTGEIIEAAVCMFDVDLGHIITARSWLVDTGNGNAAEAINGIPSRLMLRGDTLADVMHALKVVGMGAECFVAHNAEFDRSWLDDATQKAAPWVCSMSDIEWPRQGTGKVLTSIALAHGVGVVAAHRALDDVLTLARVFERCAEMGHDLPAMLTKAMLPRVVVQAIVSYDDREKAKSAGFSWDGATKRWTKRVLAGQAFDFETRVQS